jgi:predicted nucleotidyltransferase
MNRHLDKELLRVIVDRLTVRAGIQRVILFGSAARGEMSSDSDIDLLVLQTTGANIRTESVRLREALRGLGYPIDVIVMPLARFEETKDVIGSMAYPANKYGEVIYDAA